MCYFIVNIVKNLSSYAEVKTVSPTLNCFLDSSFFIGLRVLGYLAQYYYSEFSVYSIVMVLSG
jgi:hypothetical protein